MLALKKNNSLNRVVVVNTDNSDEFKSRYRRIFSKSLQDRGRLVFIDESWKERILRKPGAQLISSNQIEMNFETFIRYFMDEIARKFD